MSYPDESKLILEKWLSLNQTNPYPTTQEKKNLAIQTNLSVQQISLWFANARRILESKISQKHRISTENKIRFENFFKKNQTPDVAEIEELSRITGLDKKRIQAWFRYQKYKQKNKYQ